MIQQNINQAISLAGFLFTQTPAYQQMSQDTALKQTLNRQMKGLKTLEAEGGAATPEEILEVGKPITETRRQMYVSNPTEKNLAKYQESKGTVARWEQRAKGEKVEDVPPAEAEYFEAQQEYFANRYEEDLFADGDINLAKAQEAKRESNMRKMGYQSPSIRQWADIGRKEKHKITTQIEKEMKNEKKEEQRNG